jgi:hypothetical protein
MTTARLIASGECEDLCECFDAFPLELLQDFRPRRRRKPVADPRERAQPENCQDGK